MADEKVDKQMTYDREELKNLCLHLAHTYLEAEALDRCVWLIEENAISPRGYAKEIASILVTKRVRKFSEVDAILFKKIAYYMGL